MTSLNRDTNLLLYPMKPFDYIKAVILEKILKIVILWVPPNVIGAQRATLRFSALFRCVNNITEQKQTHGRQRCWSDYKWSVLPRTFLDL